MKELKTSMLILLVSTLLLGGGYPLMMTGIGKLLFNEKTQGSLMHDRHNKVIGSALIGQMFTGPGYFHGRPSANGYDAMNSGGSNYGHTNKKYIDEVKKRLILIRKENNLTDDAKIPSDLVLASASGLDPHISLDAALLQAPRIAGARDMDEQKLRELVKDHKEYQYLFAGYAYVNIMKLNHKLHATGGER